MVVYDNTIYYDYAYPSYSLIEDKVKKLKIKYDEELKCIEKKYNKFINKFNEKEYYQINIFRRRLLLKYTKKILDIFPQLKEFQVSVFLHGSFAKGTNRWYSDVDLNFVYPEYYKEKLFCIEELISLIMCRIFNLKTRDHIHNMMIYELNDDIKIKEFKEYYILFKEGQKISYHVRDTKKHLVYKIYNSKRNIDSFCSYVNGSYNRFPLNEWGYSFLGIDGYNYDKIENKIYKIRKNRNIGIEYYLKIAKDEILRISASSINYLNDRYYIRFLNCTFKKYYIELIQTFLIVYNEVYVNNKNVNFIQLSSCFYNDKKIFKVICKYFWLLMRIEELCHRYNLDFSYKSCDNISPKTFNEYYKNLYGTDFIDETNIITESLKQMLIKKYKEMI